jgi:hypothetical protein
VGQISLRSLGTGYYTDYAEVFAGTAVAVVPPLIVFIVSAARSWAASWKGALNA